MAPMRLDHLSYAAGPDGFQTTVDRLSELLGAEFVDGGVHPRFGTVNHILPLEGDRYIEVVDVLDHPASDKAPFGQAVRARKEMGGGWLGWVVAVRDMARMEQRLGRESVPGNRHRPDGHSKDIGDLRVLEVSVVAQEDREPLPLRQQRNSSA